MERDKIKLYCQFCLNEQELEHQKILVTRQMKQVFFSLTQKKLNTSKYSQYICCEPCLQELEAVISYRDTLVKHQKLLEDLHNLPSESVPVAEYLELEESECNETIEIEKLDDVIYVREFEEAYVKETECINCHQTIDESSFDHHVCPPLKTENEEDEHDSSSEQTLHDNSLKFKKKYPKKKLSKPISCPVCNRLFFYKAYFQFHFKDVHAENQEKVCQFCGKIFKNSRRLNSHVLIHQSETEKKFKCDKCVKQFHFSGDLSRHKRVHAESKPFKCHLCPKSFTQSYALKLHIDVHNRVKYECDMCATQFSAKRTLKNHIDKCIKGIAVIRRTSRLTDGEHSSQREKYKCVSEGCDRQFTSRQYLGVHLEKQHGIKFENFETTCLECNLMFDTVGDYTVHVKTHSCNFVCELCKLRFKTNDKLHAHKDKFHREGEDRPYLCQEQDCGARFKRAEHLRGHQMYKHSDERKIECQLCDLKFRQRGEFNVHMRVHSNSKPFSCWQCNHVCKTSSNLRQHMTLVHNETSIYFCKICHQSFKYNTDLTQHNKEHSLNTVYEVVEMS